MINAAHVVIYAQDAEKARAFLRDVLKLSHVDAGDGWLIFQLPPSELGVHPSRGDAAGPGHELFFLCDDVDATVAELQANGVEFTGPVMDRGFGRVVSFTVPGAGEMSLYQPQHALAHSLSD